MTCWTSPDALEWTFASKFASEDVPGLSGDITGWEVPEFFEMEIEGSGETTWVMVVSPAKGSPAGGNGMFRLTGSFDGTTYTVEEVDPATMWLDFGRDFDGALAWENVSEDDESMILASVMNSYGAQELVGKLRFLQLPIKELSEVTTSLTLISNQTLSAGDEWLSDVTGRALDIRMAFYPGKGSTLSLAVCKGESEQTVISYAQADGRLSMDCSKSGNIEYDGGAGGVHSTAHQPDANGQVRLCILVDECSVEAYGGGGEAVISNLIFPDTASEGLSLTADGGNVDLYSVEVFEVAL